MTFNTKLFMKTWFLIILGCFISGFLHAQEVYSSKVVDDKGNPIVGVTVELMNSKVQVTTDSAGAFVMKANARPFSLRFTHVGFLTQTVQFPTSLPASIILFRNNELLDETILKAYEGNASRKNIPAAVTVLNKNSLEKFGTQSLVAAVNTVAGVKMDERSPGSYRLSIRGNLLRSTFGVRNVKVYWNGIPFTDANGNTYINQLSIQNVDRMEIIKGPAGSMYGSGTGGVVLLQSGVSNAEQQQFIQAGTTAGSFGLFSANASFQQTGTQQTNFSFSHQESDGYRNHTNMRRDVAQYTGSYLMSSKRRINANVFASDLFYQTPGGLTRAELNANPRQARPAAGIFQSAATQQAAIYLKTLYAGVSQEYRFNSRWSNTTGLYGSYTDFVNPTIRNYEKKYEKGFGGRTVFQYQSAIFTHTLGAEIQQGFFNTGVYGNRAGVKDTLQFRAAIQSRQMNAFAQTVIQLPSNFTVNAGLSVNQFYYGYEKTSQLNAEAFSNRFDAQLVPRVAFTKGIDQISLYAAVSKGYSVPTIDEVFAGNDSFNTSLDAETAVNYEIGFKGNLLKNKLWIDAAYYFFSLQNTIVSRRDLAGGDFFTNAGKTRQQGAELTVHYVPIDNEKRFINQLKLSSSFTNIRATFSNYQQGAVKFDGNNLTGTPPNVFVFTADVQTKAKLYGNFTYSYTDHIPLNDANTFYAPSYQLLFAKIGYKIASSKGNQYHLFATAEKSLNNPYSLGNDLNAAGNRFFNPSAPEQFTVGLQCKFKVK
jgi:iron complex outermembrane receptor protein